MIVHNNYIMILRQILKNYMFGWTYVFMALRELHTPNPHISVGPLNEATCRDKSPLAWNENSLGSTRVHYRMK